MALFKQMRGKRADLDAQPLHDGFAYFCTDDGSFHIDYTDADGNLQRKQISAKDAETLEGKSLDEIKAYIEGNFIQSDYDENDPSSTSYIKNRPFYDYDNSKVYEADTGTAPVVVTDMGYMYTHLYKASDEVLTPEELYGGVIEGTWLEEMSGNSGILTHIISDADAFQSNNGGFYFEFTIDTSDESGWDPTNYIYVVSDYVAYADATGIPFTANGLYLSKTYQEGAYALASKFDRLKFENKGLKKLDNKFLDLSANEEFKKLEEQFDTLEEQTGTLSSQFNILANNIKPVIRESSFHSMVQTFTEDDTGELTPNQIIWLGDDLLGAVCIDAVYPDRVGYLVDTQTEAIANLRDSIINGGAERIGYYRIRKAALSGVPANYIKTNDYSTYDSNPLYISNGTLQLGNANYNIEGKSGTNAIRNCDLDYAIKVGLTTNTQELSDEEKRAAKQWLGISSTAPINKVGSLDDATDTEVFYKVSNEPYFMLNGEIGTMEGIPIRIIATETLPEVGEPFMDAEPPTRAIFYARTSDNTLHLYMGAWMTAEDIELPYQIISNPTEATEEGIAYIIMPTSTGTQEGLYYYQNTWKRILTEEDAVTREEYDSAMGDISTALDELHTYAQSLINGGEA